MIPLPDIASLPVPAQRLFAPDANPKVRLVAARGILPGLRAPDILTVVCLLAQAADGEVAKTAQQTLDALPEPLLKGALGAPELPAAVIDVLARRLVARPDAVAQLLRLPGCADETWELLAERGDEAVTELVATNEERLLRHPRIIELLYGNGRTRMSTADRLVELAVRNGVELHGISAWREISIAIKGELIPEPSSEPLPEDLVFSQVAELATALATAEAEDVVHEDEEGNETVRDRYLPLYKALADMTITQKIRRAYLGTKEERLMLVRDSNKIVAAAAVRSPQIRESEVVLIARNRTVPEDVLRIIGTSAEWLKSYQVKHNLVENPKTPGAIAQKLVPHLRESDLRKIARSKNVPANVQLAARRQLERRS